jgi:archaellum component FlaG (FlaF/FlaG flagellin family)
VNIFFPKGTSRIVLFAAALAVLGASACSFSNRTAIRQTQTDTDSVPLGGANSADVAIAMGPGNLKLAGGAEALMQATFKYNVPAWKPRVVYSVREGKGFLTVRQSGSTGSLTFGAQNEWNISLNNSVPLDLRIQVGAGQAYLALGALALDNLGFDEGAGDSNIDLSGNWKKNASVSIEGAEGKTVVHLPADVGARVMVEEGIGEVNAGKLKKENGAWVNSAYGKSPATLNVTIHNGTGEVDLL